MTTYGYLRVSTEEQVAGTSLDEQRRQIQGTAMATGLSIDQWIEDGGVSGASPFFDRLGQHGVRLMPGDSIVFAKLDRFSRDIRDALNTIHELKSLRVRLIINGQGDVTDVNNAQARLMLHVMAAFADFERSSIKERQKLGQKAKRARGGHIGGSAPFGYRIEGQGKAAVLVPIPELQPALADIRRLRGEGVSLRAIAKHIESTYGHPISHEGVRRATLAESA